MILRPYQEKFISELKQAMKSHNSILARAPTGAGKCLGIDTPILMYDGAIKMVQNILENDLIMGSDSQPRKVISICSGEEELYRITPNKGDSFVCNASHILSLKETKIANNHKWACKQNTKGTIINISVLEYIKQPKYTKHIQKFWRTGVDFAKDPVPLPLDPYFLGIWLGDGTSTQPSITSIDNEVIMEVYNQAEKANLTIRSEKAGGRSFVYHITTGKRGGRTDKNKITNYLKELNLLKNKHIPHQYKVSSRENRLQLLAGLIDTDGSLSGSGYDYISKSETLAKDICFLARSLGFSANITKTKKQCVNNGKWGIYYRISITGNTNEVPCRISRKTASVRKQKKDPLVCGFKVESLGIGRYYGFELSGNDRLFLLGDFTVTHNTVVASYIANGVVKKGRRAIFTVHRRELVTQTSKTFAKADIPHGFIQSGKRYDPFANIHIASIDTLRNRLNKVAAPDLLIVDECHRACSEGWSRVIKWAKTHGAYVIGLTATPWRLDGQGLNMHFDHMVHGPSVTWLMDNKYLSKYRIFAFPSPDLSDIKIKGGEFDLHDLEKIMDDKLLYGAAVSNWLRLGAGKKTIAFCPTVKVSKTLVSSFADEGISAAHLDAESPRGERKRIIEDFADGKYDILSNVNIFSEGFDLSSMIGRDVPIEAAILYRPTASLSMHLQQVGRILRPKPDAALILDHAGNCLRHGLPDEEFEWSLEPRAKKKKNADEEPPIRQCPQCYCAHPARCAACPECGFVYEIPPGKEVINGDLIELSPEKIKAMRLKEEKECKTLEDFQKLGEKRGYKPGWAHIRYQKRVERHGV